MVLNLPLRRTLAWWLLAVMLLGALAPTVSRARAALQDPRGVSWMEVCTPQGMQRVAAQDERHTPPATVVVDHCPLCVLSGDRLAPPTRPFVWLGLPQGPPAASFFESPLRLTPRIWAVQSRAPPALS